MECALADLMNPQVAFESAAAYVPLLQEQAGKLPQPRRPETCPKCRSTRFIKNGTFSLPDGTRKQRYKCRNCGRGFNQDTGTPVANLKRQKEWAKMEELMLDTISLRRMAKLLRVHLTTAFRWRHRWLEALRKQGQEPVEGRVSVNIALVPYSEKGSRICNGPGSWGYRDILRRPKPRPGDDDQPAITRHRFRRLIDGQPVRVMQAQNHIGHVHYILGQGKPDEDLLGCALSRLVTGGAKIYNFSSAPMKAVCREIRLRYRDGWAVASRIGRFRRTQPKRDDRKPRPIPIQPPSHLVEWLGLFRNVATKYLERYLAWFNQLVTHRLQAKRASTVLP